MGIGMSSVDEYLDTKRTGQFHNLTHRQDLPGDIDDMRKLDHTCSRRDRAADGERLTFLRDWWVKDTADLPTKAHHVVFTLDPRLAAAMGQTGVSADSFLLMAVGNAFKEFESRFYPGDLLGYLVALHHDRAHIHAHVLVHPLTQNGAKVNLSVLRRYKVGDTHVDVPCQQVLKDAFEREAQLACDRYLPKPEPSLAMGKERREETAEEILLIARATLEPDVKKEGKISLEELVKTREFFLDDPEYLALIRQGRSAEAHLIAEDIADGRCYELRHNFDAIAARLSKAQFEATAQARATLGIFSVAFERTSTVFVEGIGTALPWEGRINERASVNLTPSLFSDVRDRARGQKEWSEENERLGREVALLRASLLNEDKTETESLVATAHTMLRIVEAIAPTFGEEPDILTLWTPGPKGRPRLLARRTAEARLGRDLTVASTELAARHQPVNIAEFSPSTAEPAGETEVQTFEIISARPSFLARTAPISIDELLTLTPLDGPGAAVLPEP